MLRGRSVSRLPSIDALADRLHTASPVRAHRTAVVLDPVGDLAHTRRHFEAWLKQWQPHSWSIIKQREPLELELSARLSDCDLFLCASFRNAASCG